MVRRTPLRREGSRAGQDGILVEEIGRFGTGKKENIHYSRFGHPVCLDSRVGMQNIDECIRSNEVEYADGMVRRMSVEKGDRTV